MREKQEEEGEKKTTKERSVSGRSFPSKTTKAGGQDKLEADRTGFLHPSRPPNCLRSSRIAYHDFGGNEVLPTTGGRFQFFLCLPVQVNPFVNGTAGILKFMACGRKKARARRSISADVESPMCSQG